MFLLSPTAKFPLDIKFSTLDLYVWYLLKMGDAANPQQDQAYFPLWTSLSFHGHTCSGVDSGELVLAQRCCHPLSRWGLKAGLIHVDSVDVTPDPSHASNSALPVLASLRISWSDISGLFIYFIIHGRSKQRKLRGRCAADTNTNPSNELSEAELVTSAENISLSFQVRQRPVD